MKVPMERMPCFALFHYSARLFLPATGFHDRCSADGIHEHLFTNTVEC